MSSMSQQEANRPIVVESRRSKRRRKRMEEEQRKNAEGVPGVAASAGEEKQHKADEIQAATERRRRAMEVQQERWQTSTGQQQMGGGGNASMWKAFAADDGPDDDDDEDSGDLADESAVGDSGEDVDNNRYNAADWRRSGAAGRRRSRQQQRKQRGNRNDRSRSVSTKKDHPRGPNWKEMITQGPALGVFAVTVLVLIGALLMPSESDKTPVDTHGARISMIDPLPLRPSVLAEDATWQLIPDPSQVPRTIRFKLTGTGLKTGLKIEIESFLDGKKLAIDGNVELPQDDFCDVTLTLPGELPVREGVHHLSVRVQRIVSEPMRSILRWTGLIGAEIPAGSWQGRELTTDMLTMASAELEFTFVRPTPTVSSPDSSAVAEEAEFAHRQGDVGGGVGGNAKNILSGRVAPQEQPDPNKRPRLVNDPPQHDQQAFTRAQHLTQQPHRD